MEATAEEASTPAPRFAPPEVVSRPAGDGCLLLSSAQPLGPYPVTVIHSLRDWAGRNPGAPLVAERAADGSWRACSYGEAATAADSIGQALLDLGLGPDRPLLILSGNSVDHLLVMLGAMTAGIVRVRIPLRSRPRSRFVIIASPQISLSLPTPAPCAARNRHRIPCTQPGSITGNR